MKIYRIDWKYNHLVNNNYDFISIDKFETISSIKSIIGTRDVVFPQVLNFKTNSQNLESLNFPVNDLALPIFNKKLFDLVFENVVPKSIIDVNIFNNKQQIHEFGYFTFQLSSYFESFDYENSVYEEDFILPVGKITKLVLKNCNFPDVFRIKEQMSELFVTEIVKNKLCFKGIDDMIFEEVDVNK